jgi:hypothetical protein
MRVGPQLEAMRHLLRELALTLTRQSRHHFPKQAAAPRLVSGGVQRAAARSLEQAGEIPR